MTNQQSVQQLIDSMTPLGFSFVIGIDSHKLRHHTRVQIYSPFNNKYIYKWSTGTYDADGKLSIPNLEKLINETAIEALKTMIK